VQLLRRHWVSCLNNEAAAFDGNKVANRGKVWCNLAKQVTECAHRLCKSQLFFEAEGPSRFREQPG
jgi:hypothetical protein